MFHVEHRKIPDMGRDALHCVSAKNNEKQMFHVEHTQCAAGAIYWQNDHV